MNSADSVVSIIGSGSAKAARAARALLARNGVPHRWLDTDADPIGRLLAERARLGVDRPVAVFPEGSQLVAPAGLVERVPARASHGADDLAAAAGRSRNGLDALARTSPELVDRYVASAHWRTALARRVGLRTRAEHGECDVVIVGAGTAGLTAAIDRISAHPRITVRTGTCVAHASRNPLPRAGVARCRRRSIGDESPIALAVRRPSVNASMRVAPGNLADQLGGGEQATAGLGQESGAILTRPAGPSSSALMERVS